jgi:hypothetical protein
MKTLPQTTQTFVQSLSKYPVNGVPLTEPETMDLLRALLPFLNDSIGRPVAVLLDRVSVKRTGQRLRTNAVGASRESQEIEDDEPPTIDLEFEIDFEMVRAAQKENLIDAYADHLLDVLVPSGFLSREQLAKAIGADPATTSRLVHQMVDAKMLTPYRQRRRGTRPLSVYRATRSEVAGPERKAFDFGPAPTSPTSIDEWRHWLQALILSKGTGFERTDKISAVCENGAYMSDRNIVKNVLPLGIAPPDWTQLTDRDGLAKYGMTLENSDITDGQLIRAIRTQWVSEKLRATHHWRTTPPASPSEWAQWCRYRLDDRPDQGDALALEKLGREAAQLWPQLIDAQDTADHRGDILDVKRRCGRSAWRWSIIFYDDATVDLDFKNKAQTW